jgi:hypothetical protein
MVFWPPRFHKHPTGNGHEGLNKELGRVCSPIPGHALGKIVRKHGAEDLARSFDYWSHLVVLAFARVSHNLGLNDLCDQTDIHSGVLSTLRGARPARRNPLSHANTKRPAVIAEELFWTTRDPLISQAPGFGKGRFPGRLGKLRKAIPIIDSTTLELAAHCMAWASHRSRKAAANPHVRLKSKHPVKDLVPIIGVQRPPQIKGPHGNPPQQPAPRWCVALRDQGRPRHHDATMPNVPWKGIIRLPRLPTFPNPRAMHVAALASLLGCADFIGDR